MISDEKRSGGLVAWGALAGVLLLFAALVVPTVGDGVGNWDGHKILLTVQWLLDRHEVVLSRPPGHPTTDVFLFGGIGWLLRAGGGRGFDDTVFSVVQLGLALAAAGVFGWWLKNTRVPPGRIAIAVACLVFSPQFLAQTIDGVEIIGGLLLLLGAVALLWNDEAPRAGRGRLAGAVGLFALATGCRAELALAGLVLFPAYLLRGDVRTGRSWLGMAAAVGAACVVVWLPVLPVILRDGPRFWDVADIRGPVILIWGYKVLFRCFGFPASVLLLGGAAWALVRRWRPGWKDGGPRGEGAALAICGIYLALFLFQPGKPAYMLICLPFLLWLVAVRWGRLLAAVAGVTAVQLVVGVDVFRGRQLTAPHPTAGAYAEAVAGKPARRLGYIEALAGAGGPGRVALLGDVWSWVYEYHERRGMLAATPVRLGAGRGRAYAVGGDRGRVLLPREAAGNRTLLSGLHEEGYEIVIDRTLWHTLFARYETRAPAGDGAHIGEIPVRLVTVAPEG